MRTVTGTDFSSNAAEKYFNSFSLYGSLNRLAYPYNVWNS